MADNDRELVLAQNQYALIQDDKGTVSVYVGPTKLGLAANDKPVTYQDGRFQVGSLPAAIKQFINATEGFYVILENPAVSGETVKTHPNGQGLNNQAPNLQTGRKINVPGPANFALWPGQSAKVVEGHQLRSNQYLVARVYNPEEANRSTGVVEGEAKQKRLLPDAISIGKLFVIKGTDVSFYIPPTGVEVVPDINGRYVREAVTLQSLEYAILLDENGRKRYEKGPNVVFPEATEKFVEQEIDGVRANTFRAIELGPNMAVYVKVISDYEEPIAPVNGQGPGAEMPENSSLKEIDGKKWVVRSYKTGEELFIRGEDMAIYWPRAEHAIVEYSGRQRHYGVAVPEGEARYVLNKNTGKINMAVGPTIMLADPRKEVLVRRVLDDKTVALWYPGNAEALAFNRNLNSLLHQGEAGYVTEKRLESMAVSTASLNYASRSTPMIAAGDKMQRSTTFTPPHQITLNTKYEGVPSVSPYTGYAVQVVAKNGSRRVEVGPTTVLMNYDESLEVLTLSTGKPKTTDQTISTVYLKVANNVVSDVVTVETKDLVNVSLKLAYRVNFEGEKDKWFSVENYVKFLCDHLRSLLRATAKASNIADLIANASGIIRDAILGPKTAEGGKRVGKSFSENGMRVYDVEVLGVEITDRSIADVLTKAQRETVETTVNIGLEEQRLQAAKRKHDINAALAQISHNAVMTGLMLAAEAEGKRAANQQAMTEAKLNLAELELEAKTKQQEKLDAINTAEVTRLKAIADQHIAEAKAEAELFVQKFGAIDANFTAALTALGNNEINTKVATALLPLAIAEQQGVDALLTKFFRAVPGLQHLIPNKEQTKAS